jgi:arylformamidase
MASRSKIGFVRAVLIVAAIVFAPQSASPGWLRNRIALLRAVSTQNENTDADAEKPGPPALPGGIRVIRDVAYGGDSRQRFDVYVPAQAKNAPVIFMVHGGAWRTGDKAAKSVVENKVSRWVPMGFIFISANYRLLPETDPLEQARDVARAIAAAQDKAVL